MISWSLGRLPVRDLEMDCSVVFSLFLEEREFQDLTHCNTLVGWIETKVLCCVLTLEAFLAYKMFYFGFEKMDILLPFALHPGERRGDGETSGGSLQCVRCICVSVAASSPHPHPHPGRCPDTRLQPPATSWQPGAFPEPSDWLWNDPR